MRLPARYLTTDLTWRKLHGTTVTVGEQQVDRQKLGKPPRDLVTVYTKAPYFISPGSCTLTSSTSKTRVPPSTRRGGTNFSRPLPRQAVLERHGGLER